MPNHITNIIHFEGDPESIHRMLTEIKDDEAGIGSIDFNKIIPMPKALEIEAGSRTHDGLKVYNDFLAIYALGRELSKNDLLNIPEESENIFLRRRTDIDRATWNLGKAAFRNQQLYGEATWYSWCIRNWGTKWNAYNCRGNDDALEFFTAWSAPHPILQKLSEMYPGIGMTHEWADEDIGQNCGLREYLNGEMTDEWYPSGDKEALEYAAQVMGVDLAEYGLVLNSTGSDYIRCNDENYDVIEVCGQRALFSNGRLSPENIPEGMYLYHLRETDDDGALRFASLENKVVVNHGGSVMTRKPIDLGPEGRVVFSEDTDPNFLGSHMTMEEFMQSEAVETEKEAMGGMQL